MVNKVKGTYDVLPNEIAKWEYLENKIKAVAKKYNYVEMRTPMMEYSQVFHRENEQSDMVTKETYNFLDKGNREVTLKPEGTAGIIRSYVENKLYATNDLLKVYYIGEMFRYERPQKGRYRQFMQFGVEAIGPKSPLLDAEVIALSYDFINGLNLNNVVVELNSIGDNESRLSYQKALVKYLTPFKAELSEDSKVRLDKNPLRILDSKSEGDQAILKNSPKPIDYLSKESLDYFDEVKKYLEIFQVKYVVNNSLVRGLDYYSETVFEVKANIKNFGAQNVLGGGGRYESLVKELGGPETSAIGIAFGMERLLLALEYEDVLNLKDKTLDAYIITFNDEDKLYAASVIWKLRSNDLAVDFDFTNKSFKAQLKRALANNSKTLIIIGENERLNNEVTIKNTKTEEQRTIKLDDLLLNIKKELEIY